ncbi:hypothetical protein BDV29DRAFT_182142 [Aspergillus leporis]|jgi:hypothetical protein|uniref:Uncharacterized protein n=1 Tax=Aspergillus leporis TaxID=41062 RepID=A0A5N5WMU3_9EURO|nr:hypothetical protein BDV29DRAFT_182142 [Aspergillus leporis]
MVIIIFPSFFSLSFPLFEISFSISSSRGKRGRRKGKEKWEESLLLARGIIYLIKVQCFEDQESKTEAR